MSSRLHYNIFFEILTLICVNLLKKHYEDLFLVVFLETNLFLLIKPYYNIT